jgi:hypothetical protein
VNIASEQISRRSCLFEPLIPIVYGSSPLWSAKKKLDSLHYLEQVTIIICP